MNNERTVVLENVSGQPVGLKDTQNRTYRFGVGGKIRISEVSLQDILDYPASKIIFNEGMIQISNITVSRLYEMGLTEKEIKLYLGKEGYATALEAEKTIEEPHYEEIVEEEKIEEEIVEEPKEEIKEEPIEEVVEPEIEAPVAEAPVKKTTTKKTTAKKSSSKKRK